MNTEFVFPLLFSYVVAFEWTPVSSHCVFGPRLLGRDTVASVVLSSESHQAAASHASVTALTDSQIGALGQRSKWSHYIITFNVTLLFYKASISSRGRTGGSEKRGVWLASWPSRPSKDKWWRAIIICNFLDMVLLQDLLITAESHPVDGKPGHIRVWRVQSFGHLGILMHKLVSHVSFHTAHDIVPAQVRVVDSRTLQISTEGNRHTAVK